MSAVLHVSGPTTSLTLEDCTLEAAFDSPALDRLMACAARERAHVRLEHQHPNLALSAAVLPTGSMTAAESQVQGCFQITCLLCRVTSCLPGVPGQVQAQWLHTSNAILRQSPRHHAGLCGGPEPGTCLFCKNGSGAYNCIVLVLHWIPYWFHSRCWPSAGPSIHTSRLPGVDKVFFAVALCPQIGVLDEGSFLRMTNCKLGISCSMLLPEMMPGFVGLSACR
jgi:hypothetical protein